MLPVRPQANHAVCHDTTAQAVGYGTRTTASTLISAPSRSYMHTHAAESDHMHVSTATPNGPTSIGPLGPHHDQKTTSPMMTPCMRSLSAPVRRLPASWLLPLHAGRALKEGAISARDRQARPPLQRDEVDEAEAFHLHGGRGECPLLAPPAGWIEPARPSAASRLRRRAARKAAPRGNGQNSATSATKERPAAGRRRGGPCAVRRAGRVECAVGAQGAEELAMARADFPTWDLPVRRPR